MQFLVSYPYLFWSCVREVEIILIKILNFIKTNFAKQYEFTEDIAMHILKYSILRFVKSF